MYFARKYISCYAIRDVILFFSGEIACLACTFSCLLFIQVHVHNVCLLSEEILVKTHTFITYNHITTVFAWYIMGSYKVLSPVKFTKRNITVKQCFNLLFKNDDLRYYRNIGWPSFYRICLNLLIMDCVKNYEHKNKLIVNVL